MNGLMMFDGFLGNDECEKFLMFFLATKMTMTDLPLSNLSFFSANQMGMSYKLRNTNMVAKSSWNADDVGWVKTCWTPYLAR